MLATTTFDLASVGYEQSEFILTGTANSYSPTRPLSSDGKWSVKPDGRANYETRVVVYRPIDPHRFDGAVMVEWLNDTAGVDAAADWMLGHVQETREGMAWVGVSAQPVGVDELVRQDPVRYGSLNQPGNQYSYDVFSQAGAAVRAAAPKVLSGLRPRHVLAVGESQSAFYLTSYVDALAPTNHVFDGFLLHSRAGFAAPLDGSSALKLTGAPVRIRPDVGVPVFVFSTESDLALLGYFAARQPDSAQFRSWEVAGTAHYDAYGLGVGQTDRGDGTADAQLFETMTSSAAGACATPVNAGPATYVLRTAIHDLVRWVAVGTPPPHGSRLVRSRTASPDSIARDEGGIARGGIRTPQVDAPVAALTGTGGSGAGFCFLFGTTTPWSPSQLAARYVDHAAFVRTWNAATERAVRDGFIEPADAPPIKAAAAQSDVGT